MHAPLDNISHDIEEYFPLAGRLDRTKSHSDTRMETVNILGKGSNHEVEPWIKYLDDELKETKGADSVSYRLAQIVRDTLLSTGESRIIKATQRIDSYYQYEYLASDSLLKSPQGNGMATFLYDLYHFVINIICLIPFDDPNQDVLVELLVELHQLPPALCGYLGVCYSLSSGRLLY